MTRIRWRGRAKDEPAVGDVDSPIADASQVVKTAVTARLVSLLIGAALLAGPAALGVAVFEGGRVPAAVAAPAPAAVDDPDTGRVGEFATNVVVTTLTGTRDSRAPEWVEMVGSGELGLTVTAPAVVDVTPASPGRTWSVTIAATVSGKGVPTSRQFFRVPVARDGSGGLRLLGGIAQVSTPVYGEQGEVEYGERITAGPAFDAVTGFLTALLTGAGEVSRYTSPGAPIAPVTPAPYREIEVVDVTATTPVDQASAPADGAQVRVLAAATGVINKTQIPLAYAMTLTMRAGRWEISQLDLSPAVRVPSTPAASVAGSPSTASSSASSK